MRLAMSEKLTEQRILGLLEANKAHIKDFGVKTLGLFGSFAHGESSDSSDLDLVVEFDKKTFDAYMDLKLFLETLFGRSVDLVLADAIKPRLRGPILEGAVHAPGL
jgi:predicted nucleotidyltransferase